MQNIYTPLCFSRCCIALSSIDNAWSTYKLGYLIVFYCEIKMINLIFKRSALM